MAAEWEGSEGFRGGLARRPRRKCRRGLLPTPLALRLEVQRAEDPTNVVGDVAGLA